MPCTKCHTLDLQTSSLTTGCPVAPSTPQQPIWGRDLETSPHFHDVVPSPCLGLCPSPTLNHHTGCIQSCSKLNLEKDVSSCSKLIGSPRLNPVWLHCSQWQWHGGGTAVASPVSWGHCRYPALLLNPKTSHPAAPSSLVREWQTFGRLFQSTETGWVFLVAAKGKEVHYKARPHQRVLIITIFNAIQCGEAGSGIRSIFKERAFHL